MAVTLTPIALTMLSEGATGLAIAAFFVVSVLFFWGLGIWFLRNTFSGPRHFKGFEFFEQGFEFGDHDNIYLSAEDLLSILAAVLPALVSPSASLASLTTES